MCPEDDVPILTTEIHKIKKHALKGNARVIYQGSSKCHKMAKMVHLFLNVSERGIDYFWEKLVFHKSSLLRANSTGMDSKVDTLPISIIRPAIKCFWMTPTATRFSFIATQFLS